MVDGDSEFNTLPEFICGLGLSHQVVRALKASMDPAGPLPQIVRNLKTSLEILAPDRLELAIVMLDLETRVECAGAWALRIRAAILSHAHRCKVSQIEVVIKKTSFENWLIADPAALVTMRKRFKLSTTNRNKIVPDKADHVDALRILKASVIDDEYDKITDAIRILHRANPKNMASNSRSFRRLLRILAFPDYRAQSSHPV